MTLIKKMTLVKRKKTVLAMIFFFLLFMFGVSKDHLFRKPKVVFIQLTKSFIKEETKPISRESQSTTTISSVDFQSFNAISCSVSGMLTNQMNSLLTCFSLAKLWNVSLVIAPAFWDPPPGLYPSLSNLEKNGRHQLLSDLFDVKELQKQWPFHIEENPINWTLRKDIRDNTRYFNKRGLSSLSAEYLGKDLANHTFDYQDATLGTVRLFAMGTHFSFWIPEKGEMQNYMKIAKSLKPSKKSKEMARALFKKTKTDRVMVVHVRSHSPVYRSSKKRFNFQSFLQELRNSGIFFDKAGKIGDLIFFGDSTFSEAELELFRNSSFNILIATDSSESILLSMMKNFIMATQPGTQYLSMIPIVSCFDSYVELSREMSNLNGTAFFSKDQRVALIPKTKHRMWKKGKDFEVSKNESSGWPCENIF